MIEDNIVDTVFGDNISKRLEDRKRDLSILILGHYKPQKVLKRLEKFRDFLRRNGYSNARLMKDISDGRQFSKDNDEHFLIKSQVNMKVADVLFFVFFKDGEKTGPEIELADLCDIL